MSHLDERRGGWPFEPRASLTTHAKMLDSAPRPTSCSTTVPRSPSPHPPRSAITVAFIGPYIAYYTYLKFTGQGTDRPGEGTGIKRPPRTKKAKRR